MTEFAGVMINALLRQGVTQFSGETRKTVGKIRRILVTGGAGFLGSWLCERLVDMGHDVICLDNFFTSQKSNVAHLLDRPNFELIRHDVTVPVFLEVDESYNFQFFSKLMNRTTSRVQQLPGITNTIRLRRSKRR